MKLLVVVGTNAPFSYNRFLAQYIAKANSSKADIKVREIDGLKPFYKEAEEDDTIKAWRQDVKEADGVIITTPEYDHAIPAALKSALEWLGSHAGPDLMHFKPAAVLGASYGIQGSSRAQEDAREILLSPDMSANVLPGNEVLIGHAPAKFDKESGELTDEATAKQVDGLVDTFIDFIKQTQK
ncbi:NADPH-dependent FMN reductase [Lactobacillus corticis]|uniref:NADPH-dependent FMN reductase n=1 Tax=Lactobacillus corticis TaxID=2201249 RepID=A0A916QHL7_9LACO|nr:NAD(P)H-dependent oxidoreductase [Lactobacillus corticis]GFZ26408.1 NADPH-dependent FMN reductase [Lactobacillus corticis]